MQHTIDSYMGVPLSKFPGRRGLVLLGLSAAFLLGVLALAGWGSLDTVDRRLLASLLVLNIALLVLRLFAVVDASRGAGPSVSPRSSR